MKLDIEDIQISSRIREDVGDISELMQSIEEVGLISPIIVNEEYELLSGFRRLEACRQLGWTEIEVRVIDTGEDPVKKLDVEYHENLGRLDLSNDEQQVYSHTRYDLLHPQNQGFSLWKLLKRIWEIISSIFSHRSTM